MGRGQDALAGFRIEPVAREAAISPAAFRGSVSIFYQFPVPGPQRLSLEGHPGIFPFFNRELRQVASGSIQLSTLCLFAAEPASPLSNAQESEKKKGHPLSEMPLFRLRFAGDRSGYLRLHPPAADQGQVQEATEDHRIGRGLGDGCQLERADLTL